MGGLMLSQVGYVIMVAIRLLNFSDSNDKVSSNKEATRVTAIEYRKPTRALLQEWKWRYFVYS